MTYMLNMTTRKQGWNSRPFTTSCHFRQTCKLQQRWKKVHYEVVDDHHSKKTLQMNTASRGWTQVVFTKTSRRRALNQSSFNFSLLHTLCLSSFPDFPCVAILISVCSFVGQTLMYSHGSCESNQLWVDCFIFLVQKDSYREPSHFYKELDGMILNPLKGDCAQCNFARYELTRRAK